MWAGPRSVRRCLSLVVLLCCLATHSSGQRQRDFYSSVSTLSDLIHLEKEVKANLLEYVEHLKFVHDSILNFVHERQPYEDMASPSAVFDYLKHPVHAFHMTKRMTVGLGTIESYIHTMRQYDPLVNITEMRRQRLLPWDEDFNGLAASLIRLQDTYSLNLNELTKGHLRTEIPRNQTVPGRLPLNARDCFYISQVAMHQGFYDRAVEWSEQAISKAAGEEPPTITRQELDPFHESVIKKHDEVLRTMGKTGRDWQTYGVPVRDRTKRSIEFKAQLFNEDLPLDMETENYKRLCRGEQLRTPKMDSKLRCRYYKGQHGFFKLQPIKLEEANLKPYIVVMHNVIQDRDIEDLMAFAKPRLQRSTHYGVRGMEASPVRTSSNAWLNDLDAPVATRLNRFLRALLGLGTTYLGGEAEQYQLANYGIGGQYMSHHDYLQDTYHIPNRVTDDFDKTSGDRIATLMVYMSDVEEGGATVFPSLGVRLTPKKGDAAFWWNLKASGEGEKLTKHGGCPVLYGSKWIANKWFRSNSNMFRLPCFTDQEASLGPLV